MGQQNVAGSVMLVSRITINKNIMLSLKNLLTNHGNIAKLQFPAYLLDTTDKSICTPTSVTVFCLSIIYHRLFLFAIMEATLGSSSVSQAFFVYEFMVTGSSDSAIILLKSILQLDVVDVYYKFQRYCHHYLHHHDYLSLPSTL